MIQFYYHPSPNPAKVAMCLEETGLDYAMIPVDTRNGEHFAPAYLAINPNAKTPALVDGDAVVFDSTAILLYLAEKTGQFIGDNAPAARAQLLSWLMFVATGIGPYSGQAVHFKHFAPEPKGYAVNRYGYEAERHRGLIEAQLENRRYMVGDTYTIVDMSVWGWARAMPFIFGPDAWPMFPNVKRLFDDVGSRPAAERAGALATVHSFKAEMDEAAREHMFPRTSASLPPKSCLTRKLSVRSWRDIVRFARRITGRPGPQTSHRTGHAFARA